MIGYSIDQLHFIVIVIILKNLSHINHNDSFGPSYLLFFFSPYNRLITCARLNILYYADYISFFLSIFFVFYFCKNLFKINFNKKITYVCNHKFSHFRSRNMKY